MKTDTIKSSTEAAKGTLFLGDDWFDPLEAGVRTRIRDFIEELLEAELLEAELGAALGRDRYERPQLVETGAGGRPVVKAGHRHGHRERQLLGSFGPVTVRVPRARLETSNGKTAEWKNKTIPAYQRRTKKADALIAGAYLAGTNTRRVRRALSALFNGAVGKDTVSRVWRKVKGGACQRFRRAQLVGMAGGGDWDAWNKRSLADEPIIRLILDGTAVRVRLDKKSTSISLLVALGVRQDGQKVLLAIKNMGGESEAAWRVLLDDLVNRGLKTPELVIVDGAAGLDKALAALWSAMLVQRCTVHKHRNLLAHAPDRLHEEVSADYNDMIYAASKSEIEAKRKAFIRKWRVKCRAVAESLEEAGDKLFTFTRFPKSQWKSIRTSNAIERLHEEFKRRIKTQTVLPSAETAAMLFWALMASGQITMRKVDGWQSLAEKPTDQVIDLAA
jgi:putative transposase